MLINHGIVYRTSATRYPLQTHNNGSTSGWMPVDGDYFRWFTSVPYKRAKPSFTDKAALFWSGTEMYKDRENYSLKFGIDYNRCFNPNDPWSVRHRESVALPSTRRWDVVNGYFDPVAIENLIRSRARVEAVNLGMMLAEYRQTAQLFGDLSKDLIRVTRAALSRNPKLLLPKQRWSKTIAKRHLQWAYGVTPLINDITASKDALLKGLVDSPLVHMGMKVSRRQFYRGGTNNTRIGPGCFLYTPYNELREELCRTRASVLAEFHNTPLIQTLSPLGLTNPLALVYEAFPFSFVLDWWCNLGEVLASLDNLLLIKSLAYQPSTQGHVSTLASDGSGGVGTYRWEFYWRGLPRTMSLISRLAYKPSVSSSHIANGLALSVPFLESVRVKQARYSR